MSEFAKTGNRGVRGRANGNWRGGRHTDGRYIRVRYPDHPRAHQSGYVYEHILVAERAMGKPLPDGAEIHHANGDKSDNRPCNLVVCEGRSYHLLLHSRQRALEESGDANNRRCGYCGEWDDPQRMYIRHRNSWHTECQNEARRRRSAKDRTEGFRVEVGTHVRVR